MSSYTGKVTVTEGTLSAASCPGGIYVDGPDAILLPVGGTPKDTDVIYAVNGGTIRVNGNNNYNLKNVVLDNGNVGGSQNYWLKGGYQLEVNAANGTSTNIVESTISCPVFFVYGGTASITVNQYARLILKVKGQNLSGSCGFEKKGAGELLVQGANTWTGKIILTEGVTTVAGGGALGSGEIENNATLALTNTTGQTLSNVISGTGNLVKSGTGVVTLSGENPYGGKITISGGTLLINGTKSGTGTVTVASGGTLGGTGSISGQTTIQAGGTLAPGNSPGTLEFVDDVTILGDWEQEIHGNTIGEYDVVRVDTATFGDTARLNVIATNYTPQPGDSFEIMVAANNISGFDDWENLLVPENRYIWNLNLGDGGKSLVLSVDANAVPEPAAWLLLTLSLFPAAQLLRRKRR